MAVTQLGRCLQWFCAAACAAACLVWFSFLYANWPVVLSDDAHVCPDGSTLGAIETCINYTSIEGGPSAYGACFAGNIKFPCGCVDGFTPYTTKFYLWSDYVHFRCCSGGDGTSAQCGDLAHKDVTGGVLLGAGLVGFSVCTYFLRSSSTRIPLLTADDKFVENPRSQLDGPKLHQMVEMQKWGVTKDDLHQFRRLVMNAILEQRILPTERDPFDPNDFTKGPSMYTVNEQYIKPVTHQAGDASWSLMKHPEGMEVNLFITHGWAEGIFEFVDKVISSWPSRATAAYVCFLSNPQNLDIGELIASPQDSPFAKCLRNSRQMLVIPNAKGSIYTRIWCVYEAFLAYSWGKPIKTARAPVPHYWLQLLRVACACMTNTGASVFIVSSFPPLSNFTGVLATITLVALALDTFLVTYLFKTNRHTSRVLQVSIILWGALFGFARAVDSYGKSFKRSNNVLFFTLVPFIAAGLEADRLLAVEGSKQSKLLREGFRGIRHAQSANPADQERIMSEIESGKCEDAVDAAVSVLLDMNFSKPELQGVVVRAGSLGDISTWSRSMFALSLLWWIVNPNQIYLGRVIEVYDQPSVGPEVFRYILFALAAFESLSFLILFLLMPTERKSFAEKTEVLIIPFATTSLLGLWKGLSYEIGYTFVLNPIIIALSLAGPARVVRIPRIGPVLLRSLFGRNPFRSGEKKIVEDAHPDGRDQVCSDERKTSDDVEMKEIHFCIEQIQETSPTFSL